MLMLACQPVAKSRMADHIILQKENVFHTTFGSTIGWLTCTCTFNSIKVPLSNIYIYVYTLMYHFMYKYFAIQQNHDHC